jgi:hypothetical protein
MFYLENIQFKICPKQSEVAVTLWQPIPSKLAKCVYFIEGIESNFFGPKRQYITVIDLVNSLATTDKVCSTHAVMTINTRSGMVTIKDTTDVFRPGSELHAEAYFDKDKIIKVVEHVKKSKTFKFSRVTS